MKCRTALHFAVATSIGSAWRATMPVQDKKVSAIGRKTTAGVCTVIANGLPMVILSVFNAVLA